MTVELEGCVDSIVFRNEENGYTVFELATKGSAEVLTCVGSFSYISEGEYYKLVCGENQHNVYGKQYKVLSYTSVEPEDAEAMERYLGSGAVKGVGKALAARIVKQFGDDTFRVIEEEPERLADIKGISERMARSISENFYDKREMRNAMMFLQKYGISSTLSVKIYKQYGAGLYQVLRTNPYRLAEEIKGVGFKTADDIAMRGELRINPEFRTRAGMLYILNENIGMGHTYLPENEFKTQMLNTIGASEEDYNNVLDGLKIERKIICTPEGHCYLAPYYYMELAVARMLLDLDIKHRVDERKLLSALEKQEKDLGVELDDIQRDAINKIGFKNCPRWNRPRYTLVYHFPECCCCHNC